MLGTIDQLLPSHDSASGLEPLMLAEPAAMHDVALAQDTANRTLPVDPVGLGLGTSDHADPFHDSTRVRRVEGTPPEAEPTAMHAVELVQDTPSRLLEAAGPGFGTTDQAVPSHDSISA